MGTFSDTSAAKAARKNSFKKLPNGDTAWGVWTYFWDNNSYAFPIDGKWHPSKKNAYLIADNLTQEKAEELAKSINADLISALKTSPARSDIVGKK